MDFELSRESRRDPGARAPGPRELLLEAAERKLREHGLVALTPGAIAAEAGVPRDAFLYHFGDRSRLIEALLRRVLERAEVDQDVLAADDWEAQGRFARAYVQKAAGEGGEDTVGELLRLFAAGGDPEPKQALLCDRMGRWQEKIDKDGLDPAAATLVRWAADGLWLSALLGREPAEEAERKRALELLHKLTRRLPPNPKKTVDPSAT